MRGSTKKLLKFITCGSVDDGKSTLIGRILYDCKLLYADQEQALILESRLGSRGGEIDYSLLLDGLSAEREQGITIDVAYRYFTTDVRSFIVADTPGHEEYTRNMAVGASFADLAVILVDASHGVLTQTRRHARICSFMGIKNFVFAVNKMDLVDYRKSSFDEISDEIFELCKNIGITSFYVIPLSATQGDNVTKKLEKMCWYNGPTLLEYLETVEIFDDVKEDGFYMPVQRVCRPNSDFRGFQGQIESGAVNVGDEIEILPSLERAVVKSIFVLDKKTDYAFSGQAVTICLDREVDISRGCVLQKDARLKTAKNFFAKVLWMDDVKLVPGKDYWIKIGTKMTPAVVTSINCKIDVNSGEEIPVNSANKNEIVGCEIALSVLVPMAEFNTHKSMGGFILIDRVSNSTSACGTIEKISQEKQDGAVFDDFSKKIYVKLFDEFCYHPEIDAILKHPHPPVSYFPGDALPLCSEGFNYPSDFDLLCGDTFANIRKGIFVGFGNKDEKYPLIDENGFEIKKSGEIDFGQYRKIIVKK
ncbi:MAG: GTP-binding protein [Oscillospiraceae bacterium]|nr:GTP-binding protein [Oscillospiraceae bacterium]